MCRVQREKTWYAGQRGVYCGRARAKMEILVESLQMRDEMIPSRFLRVEADLDFQPVGAAVPVVIERREVNPSWSDPHAG